MAKKLKVPIDKQQRAVCKKYGVEWVEADPFFAVGLAKNISATAMPLNGHRHPVKDDFTGWMIWSGEVDLPSQPVDYFERVHVHHLGDYCPAAIRFLGLPPGWSFMVAGDFEDVWEEANAPED